MFSLDGWREILDTIAKNRLRTALTAFSVAWGIFMLVVLLGSGQGLENGVEYQFRDDAINSIWVRGGQTSLPYQGLQPGRPVQLTNTDYDEIRGRIHGVEHITGRFYIRGRLTVAYGNETGSFDIRAVHPEHRYLEKTIVTAGRFLNDIDVSEYRKTAVIGVAVRKALFKDADALGKLIRINGLAFQVVGVFTDEGGEGELEKIFIPVSTAQRTFNGADHLNNVMFTTGEASLAESETMAAAVRQRLAATHHFAVSDPRALSISNNVEEFERYRQLMNGIRLFVWVIGIGTILAGVVGVSNIMMIVVRDRTREIGIRKALGATPASIVGLVLQESVFVTTIAGAVGLLMGLSVLEVASRNLPADSSFFRNPAVDLGVALEATLLLIAAGVVAGFIPARRAARIRPIEALRED